MSLSDIQIARLLLNKSPSRKKCYSHVNDLYKDFNKEELSQWILVQLHRIHNLSITIRKINFRSRFYVQVKQVKVGDSVEYCSLRLQYCTRKDNQGGICNTFFILFNMDRPSSKILGTHVRLFLAEHPPPHDTRQPILIVTHI